jgi:hypothetical protein
LDDAGNATVFVGTNSSTCMKDYSKKDQVCTANDVRFASAENIVITDGGCNGGEFDDIGIWFSTDGDTNNDGAITGQCTVATPSFDADAQPLDIRGDIDDDHNPMFQRLELTVVCVAGANNRLNIPYCTSWSQPGANGLCTHPTQAFPSTPSKCKCDLGFTVNITVPGTLCNTTADCDNPTDCTISECKNETSIDREDRCVYTALEDNLNTTCNTGFNCVKYGICVAGLYWVHFAALRLAVAIFRKSVAVIVSTVLMMYSKNQM